MKKTVKVCATLLLVTMIVLSIIVPVFGASGAIDPKGIKGNEVTTTSMESIGGQIVTIVSVAGSIISVIVLVVLGIKYMMGSAEEKAEYKKTLMPYIIGAILVFAASAFSGVIFNFASNIKVK